MEGVEPKSPTQHEDSPSSSEICKIHADIKVEFEGVLEAIAEDENFSEMTAESYDAKKSCLIRHLTALSSLHTSLVKQHFRWTQEVFKKCPSLVKTQPGGPESAFKMYYLLAEVIKGELKDILQKVEKYENFPEMTAESYGENKSYLIIRLPELWHLHESLANEHVRLMEKVSKNCPSMSTNKLPSSLVSSLVKEYALKVKETKAPESDHRMKAMEEELKTSRKSLSDKSLKTQLENNHKLKSVAEITVRDDKIQTLESEILKLEETLKMKERTWSNDVAKLKGHLRDQSKLLDDVRSDKNRISGELKKLEDERCSRDKLIKELQTRLDRVQAEHDSSANNAKKLNNSWKEKLINRGKLSRLLKKLQGSYLLLWIIICLDTNDLANHLLPTR